MFQFLNEQEARTVLVRGPLDRQPLAEWAIQRKLAVASVGTWRRLEAGAPQSASLHVLEATA